MTFIASFFSSFLSYFIIGHLFYAISGRNSKVAKGIYGIFFVLSLFGFLTALPDAQNIGQIILLFLVNLGPLILAIWVFQRFTGALFVRINTRKIKQSIPKRAYDLYPTLKKERLQVIYMLIGSLMVMLSYFLLSDFLRFVVIGLGVIGIALSIWLYLRIKNIKVERIILIVGKQMERVYQTDVDQSKTNFKITHYFKNSNYIVDGIGLIYLKDYEGMIEKHHIFWLATGDHVPMQDEKFEIINHLIYKDHLDIFKKYEFRQLSMELSKRGHIEIKSNQRIR